MVVWQKSIKSGMAKCLDFFKFIDRLNHLLIGYTCLVPRGSDN